MIIIMALMVFGINGVNSDGIAEGNYSRLSLNDGGDERNLSRCLSSYNNLEPQQLSRYRDASGKTGSGIYGGNIYWYGSFSECKKIPESRYCLVVLNALVGLEKNKSMKITGLQYGVCIPRMCNEDNIGDELGYILKNIYTIPITPVPTIQPMIVNCAEDTEYTVGVVLTIALCVILICMCLVATMLEIMKEFYKEKDQQRQQRLEELPMVKTKNEETPLLDVNSPPAIKSETSRGDSLFKIFNCFSLIRNAGFIFNTNARPGDLTYLHGIRVLSLSWIILIHISSKIVYVLSAKNPVTVAENEVDRKHFFQRISSMVLNTENGVEAFFLLSGLLVMYVNMRKQEKNDGKINWLKFYVHRYWRLTPSYIFAILFLTELKPFFGDGPLWYTMRDTSACSHYWWTNLLYINNFYPYDAVKQCISTTWYLAADMQLYVLSPILIIVVLRFGFRSLLALASFGILVSTIIIASFVGTMDLDPMYGESRKQVGFIQHVYKKPYGQLQPYIIGMVLGYIIHKQFGEKFRLKWYHALFFWCLAAGTTLTTIYAPHDTIKDNPHIWTTGENVIFASLQWLILSMSVAWVIFACEYGYAGVVKNILSAKFWIPLSRINYAAYILQFDIIHTLTYNVETPLHFDTLVLINYYLSSLVFCYGCAFIFTLVVELPFSNLEALWIKK